LFLKKDRYQNKIKSLQKKDNLLVDPLFFKQIIN